MKRFINTINKNKIVTFISEVVVFVGIFIVIYFYFLNVDTTVAPDFIYSQF